MFWKVLFLKKVLLRGCSHEMQAREMYEKVSKLQHQNFSVEENGLSINPMATHWSFSWWHHLLPMLWKRRSRNKMLLLPSGWSNWFHSSKWQKNFAWKKLMGNCNWALTICTITNSNSVVCMWHRVLWFLCMHICWHCWWISYAYWVHTQKLLIQDKLCGNGKNLF